MICYFQYKGLCQNGQITIQKTFAKNKEEVLKNLKQLQITPIFVKSIKIPFKNVNKDFTIPFFRKLNQFLKNKLDLTTSLKLIEKSENSEHSKLLIQYIIQNLKLGNSFSSILFIANNIFNVLTIKTIEISERTAKLSFSISNILKHLEETEKLKTDLKNALRYPVILCVCVMFVMIFWIIFIIPKFSEIFQDMNIKLPLITRCIIKFSELIRSNLYVIISLFSIICVFIGLKIKTSKIYFKIPFISKIRREMCISDFCSGMALMLGEHMHIVECLNILNNNIFEKYLNKIERLLRTGNTISNSFRMSKIFDNNQISIIEIGEKSGNLHNSFKMLSILMQERIRSKLNKITTTIQPFAILFIGMILIIMIYSVIIPMYEGLNINF